MYGPSKRMAKIKTHKMHCLIPHQGASKENVVKKQPQQVQTAKSFQEGKVNHFCQVLEMLNCLKSKI